MAELVNFECDQRANFSRVWTWYTDTARTTAMDLSGYTALMEVRDSSDTLVLTLSTANSRIALGGAEGTITLTVDDADTEALDPGTYDYDLTLTSSGGTTTRLIEGVFTVKAAVTQV
jgi:hypothetical protein